MENVAFFSLFIFGIFLIYAGLQMFFNPEKVRNTIAKAGSTYFINYAELSIRLIIGLCFIIVSKENMYQFYLSVIGYFLIISAVLLMMLPIKTHNKFSKKAAEALEPIYLKLCAPFSVFFGGLLIYVLL